MPIPRLSPRRFERPGHRADHTTWLDSPLPEERLAPVREGVCPLDREALWTTRQAAVEGIGFVLQDASLRPPWKKWFIAKQIFSTEKGCYPVPDTAKGALRPRPTG